MRGDRRNNGEIPPYWFLLRSSCIAATFHSNILAISVWSASIIIFLYWKQVHLILVQYHLLKFWFWEFFQKCSIFQNIWPIQLRGSGRVLRLSCFSFVYIENLEWILLSNTFLRKIFSFMAQQFSLALVFLNLWLFLFHIIHFHLRKIASFCPDPSDKYPQASAGSKSKYKSVCRTNILQFKTKKL